MGATTSFMQLATVGNALLWPLAAGVAVVAWSRIRAAAHSRRVAEAETRLQQAYRTLEGRRVPENLARVVDALEEGETRASHGAAPAKQETPAGS